MGTYIALKVKWQKQKYDVSVRLDAPAEELKSMVKSNPIGMHCFKRRWLGQNLMPAECRCVSFMIGP